MPGPRPVPCTRECGLKGSSLPKVAGPDVDVSESGAVVAHVDFAGSIIEDHGRTVHLPLEGIEPLSRRRLHLSSVAHRRYLWLFHQGRVGRVDSLAAKVLVSPKTAHPC